MYKITFFKINTKEKRRHLLLLLPGNLVERGGGQGGISSEGAKIFIPRNYPVEPQPRGVPGLAMLFAGSSATSGAGCAGGRGRLGGGQDARPRMSEKYLQAGNA